MFEEDALSWEDKLNRIMALFDVWIDVQRRWVYLEGIFTGSADIKHLLPVETQRFQRLIKNIPYISILFFYFFMRTYKNKSFFLYATVSAQSSWHL